MATPSAPLDLDNIQGDILEGLAKKREAFVFFYITNPTHFRHSFQSIIPLITTTTQARADHDAIKEHKRKGHTGLIKLVGTNIAFSQAGLYALGILDDLNDALFAAGQLADASKNFAADGLADPGIVTGVHTDPAWDPLFKQVIHGCVLITGDSDATVHEREQQIHRILRGTIKHLETVYGAVRPGSESGHEHFGFQDGLSQPPIDGFRDPNAGEDLTPPGIILLGENGDGNIKSRPAWAKDSSFLVFRKLRQFVPEFNNFLDSNPIPDKDLTPEQGRELLGARFVGRWKSGTPIDRHPTEDVPDEATNPNLVNNFDYSDDPNQVRCPFTAHLRKMNPRAGAIPGIVPTRSRRIIRQGIAYGPEVDQIEKRAKSTLHDRGLLFVCYQSTLSLGFHFLQRNWANNPGFPLAGNGFDPLIGQAINGPRFITGTDPENVAGSLNLPKNLFVFPLGGEYFLSPSISALKTKIAA